MIHVKGNDNQIDINLKNKNVKALSTPKRSGKIAGKHRDMMGQDDSAEFTSSDMLTLVTNYKAMII